MNDNSVPSNPLSQHGSIRIIIYINNSRWNEFIINILSLLLKKILLIFLILLIKTVIDRKRPTKEKAVQKRSWFN